MPCYQNLRGIHVYLKFSFEGVLQVPQRRGRGVVIDKTTILYK